MRSVIRRLNRRRVGGNVEIKDGRGFHGLHNPHRVGSLNPKRVDPGSGFGEDHGDGVEVSPVIDDGFQVHGLLRWCVPHGTDTLEEPRGRPGFFVEHSHEAKVEENHTVGWEEHQVFGFDIEVNQVLVSKMGTGVEQMFGQPQAFPKVAGMMVDQV